MGVAFRRTGGRTLFTNLIGFVTGSEPSELPTSRNKKVVPDRKEKQRFQLVDNLNTI